MPDDAPLIAVVVVAIQHFVVVHADGDLLAGAGLNRRDDGVHPVGDGVGPFHLAGVVGEAVEPEAAACRHVVGDRGELRFRQRRGAEGVDDEQAGRRGVQIGRGDLIEVEEHVVAMGRHVVDEGSDAVEVRGDVVVAVVNDDERHPLVGRVELQGGAVVLRGVGSGRALQFRHDFDGADLGGLPGDVGVDVRAGTGAAGRHRHRHRADEAIVDAEGDREGLRRRAAIGDACREEVGVVDGGDGRLHGQIGDADVFLTHRPDRGGDDAVAIGLRRHHEVVVHAGRDVEREAPVEGSAGRLRRGDHHAAVAVELQLRGELVIRIFAPDFEGEVAGVGELRAHPIAVGLEEELGVGVLGGVRAAGAQRVEQVALGKRRHHHAGAMRRDRAPAGRVIVGVVGRADLPAVIERADPLVPGEEVRAAPTVADFLELRDAFDFGMILPIVEVDPARMVELHHRAVAVQRLRAGDRQPVIEAVHGLPPFQVGRVIGVGEVDVAADGMADRVVDVEVSLRALRVLKAAQGHKNAVFGEGLDLRQGVGPFGIVNRVGVVADRQEIQPGGLRARERLEGRQRAIRVAGVIVDVALVGEHRRLRPGGEAPHAVRCDDRQASPIGDGGCDGEGVDRLREKQAARIERQP